MVEFVDTNVFVYAHDRDAGDKHIIAVDLIARLARSRELATSAQVVNELANVLHRKLKVDRAAAVASVSAHAIVLPLTGELTALALGPALANSRALAAERPESGEAWRRLGNMCERWGRATEAEEAWRRAVQVDVKEFEAAHSLAVLHFRADRPQVAFPFLCAAIERLPSAGDLDAELRRKFGESLAWWLEEIVAGSDEPIALEAVWPDGAIRRDGVLMRLSSVDLRKVTDWKRLGAFLARSDTKARLTPRMPVDDEYTQLQALLDGVDPSDDDLERPLVVTPPAPHVRTSPRVGRNDPCPCRSGKKWKKCCANVPAQEPATAR